MERWSRDISLGSWSERKRFLRYRSDGGSSAKDGQNLTPTAAQPEPGASSEKHDVVYWKEGALGMSCGFSCRGAAGTEPAESPGSSGGHPSGSLAGKTDKAHREGINEGRIFHYLL